MQQAARQHENRQRIAAYSRSRPLLLTFIQVFMFHDELLGQFGGPRMPLEGLSHLIAMRWVMQQRDKAQLMSKRCLQHCVMIRRLNLSGMRLCLCPQGPLMPCACGSFAFHTCLNSFHLS
jgi:hypothetical protein